MAALVLVRSLVWYRDRLQGSPVLRNKANSVPQLGGAGASRKHHARLPRFRPLCMVFDTGARIPAHAAFAKFVFLRKESAAGDEHAAGRAAELEPIPARDRLP